jgi:CelD/BcsL family acetyltransferase involved in cellulose biosynthesis
VSIEVAIIQNEQQFAALEEQWEELYYDSPLATPFQSWAWLYSWWEFYGRDYELWLITVRNDRGLLVGVAPLMLERMVGCGRLLFVGTGLTDHLGHTLIAVFVKVDPAGWRGLAGRTPRPPNRFALTENPVPKPGDQY